jgi:hypothetical protein
MLDLPKGARMAPPLSQRPASPLAAFMLGLWPVAFIVVSWAVIVVAVAVAEGRCAG